MNRLWATITAVSVLLVGTASSAVLKGATGRTIKYGATIATSATPRQVLTACFVPDIQNQTSQDDHPTAANVDNCSLPTTQDCVGSYCTNSPYCGTSWKNTGRILLRNMAYDMTGQWSKVNWDAIKGFDTEPKSRPMAGDHPPCDVVIGLGDNTDIDDPVTITNPTYAQLSAVDKDKVEASMEFWSIIDASGIPYIIARGNHDPELVFREMLTRLGVTGKSFYYTGHGDGDQYAIKFSTGLGKQFCILTSDDGVNAVAGDQRTASEVTWLTTNTGCGGNLPTIVAGHEGVSDAGSLLAHLSSLIADANNDEILVIAGGHYTPGTPTSYKNTTTNFAGKVVLKLFSNWQEMNRHNNGTSTPYGVTASDGAGDFYTILRIDGTDNTMSAWDWSPYFNTRSVPASGSGYYGVSTYSATFNFSSRYP